MYWAEVYRADGVFDGVVSDIIDVRIRQQLDSVGTTQITIPSSSPGSTILAAGKTIHVYTAIDGGKTLLAQAILKRKRIAVRDQSQTSWEGAEGIEAFQHSYTGRSRIFRDVSFREMALSLTNVERADGWQVRIEDALNDVALLFDGVTTYKALRYAAGLQGAHVRAGLTANRLEIGSFGDVVLRTAQAGTQQMSRHPDVAFIESLEITEDSADVVNWIEPIAGGMGGPAALTLRWASRAGPFPVQSETAENGSTRYFMADAASIAQYGKIQRVYPVMMIQPIAATEAGLTSAADMLYDAGATHLKRVAQPKRTYRLRLRDVRKRLRPGDKIHVVYKGMVRHQHQNVEWLDLDEVLWIVGLSEMFADSGHQLEVEVSNVDTSPESGANMLATEIKALRQESISGMLMTSGRISETTFATVESGSPATVELTLQNQSVGLVSAELTITRADTSNPDALYIRVDGQNLPGNPYLSGATAGLSITVDIVEYLMNGAVPLKDTHTIQISAGIGSGPLDVRLDLVEAALQKNNFA